MADTVFSKIIRGEIPCFRVYEDDHVLAFLDVNPLSEGHTLVIPKEEAAELDQLSDQSAAAVGRVLPRIVRAVKAATGCEGVNVLQNNGRAAHQEVMHVHFHVIPRASSGEGLGVGWKARKLDMAAGPELARRIASSIGPTG